MKSSSLPTVLILAFSVVVLTTFTACGKKETESKTVIIEKETPAAVHVEPAPEPKKPEVSISVEGDGKNTGYEVHVEK